MKDEKVTRNVKEKVYILFYQAFVSPRYFAVSRSCWTESLKFIITA